MSFEIVTREAQKLSGMIWEGRYEEAGAGAVKKTIAEMERLRGRLARRAGEAAGLIGISWNDIPGGFRYLVALPPALTKGGEGEGLPVWSFPQMQFATAWHGAADGDVFAHYRRMFAWIEESGRERSAENDASSGGISGQPRSRWPAAAAVDDAGRATESWLTGVASLERSGIMVRSHKS